MTTKIDKPIIRSQEAPRQIIFEDYKLNGELPITGGWGYTKDDAVIIDKNDPVVPEGLPFDGVGIMPDADRLYNKEAKRIANEADFLVLGGFDSNCQNLSPFNKISSILFK